MISQELDDLIDSLSALAGSDCITVEHRLILGLLLSVAQNHDATSFRLDQFEAFREAMLELKRPILSGLDVQRIMRKLSDLGLRVSLPLAACAENEKYAAGSLDDLISAVLDMGR